MTDSLKRLMEERKALDAEIEHLRTETRRTALKEARELIEKFEIVPLEIGFQEKPVHVPASASAPATRTPLAPQFRDPDTGATWSGRGKPPKWIAGKDRAAFKL